jgi:lipoate-protein ligase A
MRYLDLRLSTPAENLACDEALLEECEERGGPEVLRVWEGSQTFVVVGYANPVRAEVNVAACEQLGVPVFRRCSGGGTVLQGPGCLNYALVLRLAEHAELETITSANRYIMERNRNALAPLVSGAVQVQGVTDLTLDGRKFSGNSQRRQRKALLFHGTLLLDFDLEPVQRCLATPSRQPEYRRRRSHRDFLTNLHLPAAVVKTVLRGAWSAATPLDAVPQGAIARLVRERYAAAAWTWKF